MEDFKVRLQYHGLPIKIAKTSILSLLSGKNTAFCTGTGCMRLGCYYLSSGQTSKD